MSNYRDNNSIIENFDIGQIDEQTEILKEKVDRADAEKNKTPSPVSAMYYFFMLSIFYMIITTILIYTSVASNSTGIAVNLIFILLLVLGLYFINMSTIKNLCGSDDDNYIIPYQKVATITFIPWVIVFGTIFFLLELFPGWVRPFSNTIGYLIVKFLGVESVFKKYLKHASDYSEGKNKQLKTAIEFLNKNTSMFINEFPSDDNGFEESFNQLQTSGVVKEGTSLKDFEIYLKKIIKIKHTIGKGVWYILSGTVVSSVSYNILLDIECQKSREKVNKSINNLYSEAISKTGSKWRLMKPEFKDSNGNYIKIQTNPGHPVSDNNLNLKQTTNGHSYIFINYENISRDNEFKHRFSKKDTVNNASIPYLDNGAVNWGGIVEFTNHDMSKYTMNNIELEEGNFIGIEIDNPDSISYTYNNGEEHTLTNLFYEVIE